MNILGTAFSRFAARPGYQIPGTVAMIWVNIVVMVFGIVSTSAAIAIFPNESRLLWAPYELLGAWLKVGGAGARAGAFFSGLCFVLAQIIMNVTANG
jgi:cytosine/uracil/thiamine/allantoin permease